MRSTECRTYECGNPRMPRSTLCLDCQLDGRPEVYGRPRKPGYVESARPVVVPRTRYFPTLQSYSLHPVD